MKANTGPAGPDCSPPPLALSLDPNFKNSGRRKHIIGAWSAGGCGSRGRKDWEAKLKHA